MSLLDSVRSYAPRAVGLGPSLGLYRHSLPLLDGGELDLSTRRGQPTLIVNTASKCGFATQYFALQKVYDRFRDQGLLVLGCPSNEFGGLEFDTVEEIREFGGGPYEIEFPLTEPMSVRFEPDPLWGELAAAPGSGPPVWNFNKYLIRGDGQVAGWWSTNVRPDSARIVDAIKATLFG